MPNQNFSWVVTRYFSFFSILLHTHKGNWIFESHHWIEQEKLHQYWKFHARYPKFVSTLPWSSCEIQLFVYIFRQNSKWLSEVQKGSPVKFFEVSYYQNLNAYLDLNQQTASLEKKTIVWNDWLIKRNM